MIPQIIMRQTPDIFPCPAALSRPTLLAMLPACALAIAAQPATGREAPPPAPPPLVQAPLSPQEAPPAPSSQRAGGTALGLLSAAQLLTSWTETADDLSHVTLNVTAGYEIVKSGVQIEGTGAFHLAHPQPPSTQTILLDPVFEVAADRILFFESRLGTATFFKLRLP